MNVLHYVLSCMYMPYDIKLPCAMIVRIRLKGNPLQKPMFSNPLKIESMHIHLIIIKLEVAEMTKMTH